MTVEQRTAPQPIQTALNLFRYAPFQEEGVKKDFEASRTFIRQVDHAFVAFGNFKKASVRRIERLADAEKSAEKQAQYFRGSWTVSSVYLKMHEDLSKIGASEQDVFDLFKTVLTINMTANDETQKALFERKKHKERIAKDKLAFINRKSEQVEKPSWFNGSQKNWERFVSLMSRFDEFLVGITTPAYTLDGDTYRVYPAPLVDKSVLPDWVSEFYDTPPPLDEVRQEQEEDSDELYQITRQYAQIQKQDRVIHEIFEEKLQKINRWIIERTDSVYFNNLSLSWLIMNLKVMDEVLAIRRREGLDVSDNNLEKIGRLVRKDPALYFAHVYLETEKAFITIEALALWIEDRLKKAGVISSVKEGLTDSHIEAFKLALGIVSPDRLDSRWNGIRDSNKTLFNALYYDIRPFTFILDEENLADILNFMEESKQGPVEAVIWWITDTIFENQHKFLLETELSSKEINLVRSAVNRYYKFFVLWTRSNWQAAWDLLAQAVTGTKRNAVVASSDQPPSDQKIKASIEELKRANEETEKETRSVQAGALDGWNIYYLTNIHDPNNRKYWDPIPGYTLDEREEALKTYTTEERITCTADPSLVLQKLHDIAEDPTTEEDIRMRHRVDGHKYKKRKIATHMRLLYQVDRNNREIIFHLYRKEDRSYRKL